MKYMKEEEPRSIPMNIRVTPKTKAMIEELSQNKRRSFADLISDWVRRDHEAMEAHLSKVNVA